MALLVKQNINTATGSSVVLTAADAGGDEVAHESNLRLLVFNGGGSAIDVTITSHVPTRAPTGPENLVVEVDAGDIGVIPLGNPGYRNSSGRVEIDYDSVSNVEVAVISG